MIINLGGTYQLTLTHTQTPIHTSDEGCIHHFSSVGLWQTH
jgi:hypothetical protein